MDEIPKHLWLPKIESVIPDRNEPPQGGGEPAIICMGAVVANAIFDVTGARLYQMPMTPERVLEALKKFSLISSLLRSETKKGKGLHIEISCNSFLYILVEFNLRIGELSELILHKRLLI